MANKTIVNCETGEIQNVPLTAEEIKELEEIRKVGEARREAERLEAEAKAEAKASALAKLTALGLTEDEAKAIVG